MVDYNSQQTISTPPGDVLKIAILERRHYVIGAIQAMRKLIIRGGQANVQEVKPALEALFLELDPALQADLPEKEYGELKQNVWCEEDDDAKKTMAAFSTINTWLYKKNLTKFDTRKSVDHTDIEAVNNSNGF